MGASVHVHMLHMPKPGPARYKGRFNNYKETDIFSNLLFRIGFEAFSGLRSVVFEWSKSVAFKAGVSQRRFESGRP